MRGSFGSMFAGAAALGLVVLLGAGPACAAFVHGGHGGGGFHGFHGGGFHGGGFRSRGGFHGFHGFHGGFARGFPGHFHALMAGRHWNYYHSNGRWGTGWGRHGGFAARFLPAPHGFAGGLGRNWSRARLAGNRGIWAGYGGYGGWDGYYADYDGLWGGDVVGLAGLAAGVAIGGDDCLIYTPIYDNLGQYLGVEPIDLCSI